MQSLKFNRQIEWEGTAGQPAKKVGKFSFEYLADFDVRQTDYAIQYIKDHAKEALVEQSFGRHSDVLIRFASGVANAADWARAHGGMLEEGVAHFAVAQPTEIATLLDAAGRDGLEVIDVVLRRPNLESVFLHLTGRDLRQ